MTSNKLFYYGIGGALIITGVVLLLGGELYLPTRHPPRQIHLTGASFAFFGLSPFFAGCANVLIGYNENKQDSFIVQVLIGAAILLMIAALLMANKS